MQTKKKLCVGFAGGGTGGHVMPIAALCEHMYYTTQGQHNCKCYWLGSPRSLEEDIASRYIEVTFLPLLSGKRRSYISIGSIIANIRDVFLLCVGCIQALYYLVRYRIDVIMCKGGYVALPVIIAARCLGRKIIVHESDTVPGKTNRLAMRYATICLLGLPLHTTLLWTPHAGVDVIGQLLSPVLYENESSDDVNCTHTPCTGKTVVLVLLGSQGSTHVLQLLYQILTTDETIMHAYEWIVCTGRQNTSFIDKFTTLKRQNPSASIEVYDFVDHSILGMLYDRADWCISRGSATALAEQKLFDIQHIIIPLPHSSGNHQYHNATRFQKTYNDIVVLQNERLCGTLMDLLISDLARKQKTTTLLMRKKAIEGPLSKTRSYIVGSVVSA